MLQDKRPREVGASLLETAIIVPLLLLILAGVVDVGRAYHTYITMLNAAREGARVGVNYPWDTGRICTTVVNEASTSGVDLSTATCSVTQSGSGNPVRVTVQMNFSLVMGGVLGSGSIPLQATAVFRAR
ncbi:MAG: pilus assembly protein [Anaerolineae bacterium]|nr:pilus assembly protein [Anaerolineae bacterium]